MADGSGFVSWTQTAKLRLILQSEAAECALACIAMISCYHGHDIDIAAIRRRYGSSLKGVTLSRVVEISESLGFNTRPIRAELEYLHGASVPCIAHWDMNHFIVIERVKSGYLYILDPAAGRRKISLEAASKHFTGVLLELEPVEEFTPIQERRAISIRRLAGRIVGLKRALVQAIVLAFAIEIIGLLLPLQMQWVVDQGLLSGDANLLLVMGGGFLILVLIQASLVAARGWLMSWLGANVSSQWVTNMFAHLIKLPLDFFEKRHLGDIISRFSSMYVIQSTMTGSFVAVILDGIVGCIALAMMMAYSPLLALAVVTTVAIYSGLRAAFFRYLWRANEQQVVYQARQQSELMESIRGIQAIKLANKHAERKARLANATVEAARKSMESQRVGFVFAAINQALFSSQRVVLIALGAYLAILGSLSGGMIVAFVAYADQFSIKFGSLIDKIVEFRMLGLHAERLSDIALAEPERLDLASRSFDDRSSTIQINGLSFRYSGSDPWVIRSLDLRIEEGESIAIVGASGCGKSTFAKLLLGLLNPQEGSITVGGVSNRAARSDRDGCVMAAVMQDDHLFSGTIADNIAFGDTNAQFDDVQKSAIEAAIHDEIMRMPMGYETLIGDMGSTLSGGQKQRLLLARALFQRPKILVLDEATSHLDVTNEAKTNETIKRLKITRIVIAHRKETIVQADRVFDLSRRVEVDMRAPQQLC